jgi:hypothetical protein
MLMLFENDNFKLMEGELSFLRVTVCDKALNINFMSILRRSIINFTIDFHELA